MPAQLPDHPPLQPGGVPLIGMREQQMQAQLMQAVSQMTTAIYIQLASAHIVTVDRPHQIPDREQLQQLARDAQTAAKAYFEGLGVVKVDAPAEKEGAT